jgi:hypothetical protein
MGNILNKNKKKNKYYTFTIREHDEFWRKYKEDHKYNTNKSKMLTKDELESFIEYNGDDVYHFGLVKYTNEDLNKFYGKNTTNDDKRIIGYLIDYWRLKIKTNKRYKKKNIINSSKSKSKSK